jgi:hypothetical protein
MIKLANAYVHLELLPALVELNITNRLAPAKNVPFLLKDVALVAYGILTLVNVSNAIPPVVDAKAKICGIKILVSVRNAKPQTVDVENSKFGIIKYVNVHVPQSHLSAIAAPNIIQILVDANNALLLVLDVALEISGMQLNANVINVLLLLPDVVEGKFGTVYHVDVNNNLQVAEHLRVDVNLVLNGIFNNANVLALIKLSAL